MAKEVKGDQKNSEMGHMCNFAQIRGTLNEIVSHEYPIQLRGGGSMSVLSICPSKRTLRRSCSQLELQLVERTIALQNLSQRLLKVQDEERRRVARDLHDSTGQTLTALRINVALLQEQL